MESKDAHFTTLKKRYNDERIREAALRRAHLAYKTIKFGDNYKSGKVRFLLAQMHQNYYFGFFETACTMAGILLEQGLVLRLYNYLRKYGPIPYRKKGKIVWIQNREDLLSLDLVDLLQIVYEEQILKNEKLILYSHQIRWIRNMVVHDRIPQFRKRENGVLEMRVIKSRRKPVKYATIKINEEEIKGLTGKRGEATAYFCISRVRNVLEELLIDDSKKSIGIGDLENENSSYLFQW